MDMYEARQNKEKVSRRIDKYCTSNKLLQSQTNKGTIQNYIDNYRKPPFCHFEQKNIQCYTEIVSNVNGTNPMDDNNSQAYHNWRIISNQKGIIPLKQGLRPIYNLMRHDGTGIGPGSCNAVAEYCSPYYGGMFYTAIGNSYAQQAGVHAERQAIQNVLQIAENLDPGQANSCNITRIYVELSPCPSCHNFLPGLVPNATVMYDFDYYYEKSKWSKYKKQEAKKTPYGTKVHLPHESGGSSYFSILMNPI